MGRTITLAGVTVAVVVLVFISAPWFALRGLQTAARDGDVHALAELIDFGAVRSGLRAQFTPGASVPPPKIWDDPVGALSRAMQAPRTPALEVDGYLTPRGLHALIGDPQAFPAVRHWGPNRVRFAVGARQETLLTFQRRGSLRWQLVQLRVPEPAGDRRAREQELAR
jgi:Protein of unknown function (DUF2939)